MREKEIGKQSVLRDAYLFAAPILSDRESVEGDHLRGRCISVMNICGPDCCFRAAFNAKMLENPEKPRTMWRVTSNGDFGALLLLLPIRTYLTARP